MLLISKMVEQALSRIRGSLDVFEDNTGRGPQAFFAPLHVATEIYGCPFEVVPWLPYEDKTQPPSGLRAIGAGARFISYDLNDQHWAVPLKLAVYTYPLVHIVQIAPPGENLFSFGMLTSKLPDIAFATPFIRPVATPGYKFPDKLLSPHLPFFALPTL